MSKNGIPFFMTSPRSKDPNISTKFPRSQSLRFRNSSAPAVRHHSSSKLIITDKDLIFCSQSPNYEHSLKKSGSIKLTSLGQSQIKKSKSASINFFVENFPQSILQNHFKFEDNGLEEKVAENFWESDEDVTEDEYTNKSENIFRKRHVTLTKHDKLGLGLSIQTGLNISLPAVVVAIKNGSPAEKNGKVFVGDRIISVNNVPIDETTSHHDACQLLRECGDKVHLVLIHSKSVINPRKKWKIKSLNFGSLRKENMLNDNNNNNLIKKNEENEKPKLIAEVDFSKIHINRSSSMNDLKGFFRVDLFLAGITSYVSYIDKLRDSSFELLTNADRSIVLHCINEEINCQWRKVIRSTIESLTNNFIKFFNKQISVGDHIFFMGWVSECQLNHQSNWSLAATLKLQQNSTNRWVSRYLIIKGENIYLFNSPPKTLLLSYQRKTRNFTVDCTRSSGSSLGSVGSSASDASISSTGTSSQSNTATSRYNEILIITLKQRQDRILKLNKDLENQFSLQATNCFNSLNSDFRLVKPTEQLDKKPHCFIIRSGNSTAQYFSTECKNELKNLNNAWNRANYQSVIKIKNKNFHVVLESENIFGSLIIDWSYGFSFYDPKHNNYLWSFKFHQLKHSSDDGKDRLILTFVIDPNNSTTKTYILRSRSLQTLLFCIHAFLCAKVYSLYL